MRWRFCLALLFCVGLTFTLAAEGGAPAGDSVDGEEDEAKVEEEVDAGKTASEGGVTKDKDLDEEEEVKTLQPSPDVETSVLFTKPTNKQELPAAGIVKFLVGFYNKGQGNFLIQSLDVSFRYPMDYNFYIQNYTAAQIDRIVPSGGEATFDYAFVPSEQYAGRPLGLVVNLNYKDENGTQLYQNAVFNETVNIVEEETAFNPETSFLYIFLACIAVLILLLGQQFLQKMRKKHGMTRQKQPVEMGTSNSTDVDLDWIPKEILNHNNKSPRPASPRQRKPKRAAGSVNSE